METLVESSGTASEPAASGSFRPLVIVSLAVLRIVDGELAALLQQGPPTPAGGVDGTWVVPQRIPRPGESLDDAARAELLERTGSPRVHTEQLHAWGEFKPESADPVVQVGYLCLTPPPAPQSRSSISANTQWWPLSRLPDLRGEAKTLLEHARSRLRRKLNDTSIARCLLPLEFTLTDLQTVYELAEGRTLDKRNFRKWVLSNSLVEPTPWERRDGAHRPARLYRFAERMSASLD